MEMPRCCHHGTGAVLHRRLLALVTESALEGSGGGMKQRNESMGSFCSVSGISCACKVRVLLMSPKSPRMHCVVSMHILRTTLHNIIIYYNIYNLLHAMPRRAQPLTLRGGLWSSSRSPNLQTMAIMAGKSKRACRQTVSPVSTCALGPSLFRFISIHISSVEFVSIRFNSFQFVSGRQV